MQRRWQTIGTKAAATASLLKEDQFVIPANFIGGAGLFKQVNQIRATTKQHMLAIDYLVKRWMLIGRGAAANKWPAFQQLDIEAGSRERAGCSQASDARTDYCHRPDYILIQVVLDVRIRSGARRQSLF